MKARATKRRSKGGRPRKDAPRHPCGKLVQNVDPNPRVVELRQMLLGGAPAHPATAENAMSLAWARGWISEEQHRAGVAYATAWRRSHPQRRTIASLPESPDGSARDGRRISEMCDAEIVEVFDAILNATSSAPTEETDAQARARYNAMSRAMTAEEQAEVFLCFCVASWPQWILQRCAGRFDTAWERKHRLLVSGLETLTALRRPANHGRAFRNGIVA